MKIFTKTRQHGYRFMPIVNPRIKKYDAIYAISENLLMNPMNLFPNAIHVTDMIWYSHPKS